MDYENKLLEIRLNNGLSQKEIAGRLKMNVTVYARYERGERDLPLSIAKNIADEFDITLDYLTGRSEKKELPEVKPSDFEKLNERIIALEKAQKK